jgi:hypothetical protein
MRSKQNRPDTQISFPFDSAEGLIVPARAAMRIIKEPLNLVEFPFAVLDDRSSDITILRFQDEITHQRTGKTLQRVWTVSPSQAFGMPTAYDEMVYVILLELTKEIGFSSRTVPFSRYDILQRINPARGKHNGDQYARVSLALDRMVGATIKAENAFYSRATQSYRSATFHLLDKAVVSEERNSQGHETNGSFFVWGQELFESMDTDHYHKDLDVDFYIKRKLPTTRRLYRYLDMKKHDGKPRFEIDLRKLCFNRLGFPTAYNFTSRLIQKLKPANDELQEAGFIRSWSVEEAKGGGFKAVYEFGKKVWVAAQIQPDLFAPPAEEPKKIAPRHGDIDITPAPTPKAAAKPPLVPPEAPQALHVASDPNPVLQVAPGAEPEPVVVGQKFFVPKKPYLLNEDKQRIVDTLKGYGLAEKTCVMFVGAEKTLQPARNWAEWWPYEQAKNPDYTIGYLRRAIEDGYAVCKPYQDAMAAKAQSARKEAQRNQNIAEKETATKQKAGTQKRIDDYLESLSQQETDQLDKEAFERIKPEARNKATGRTVDAFQRSHRNAIIKERIAEIDANS